MARGIAHWMTAVALSGAIFCVAGAIGRSVSAQVVVDRVVARVEGDILLLSEVRELGQFQQLADGQSEPQAKRLDELIDQWIIEHEAQAALFSQPTDADVNAEMQHLQTEFGGADALEKRMKEIDFSPDALKRQVRREVYFARYLEYKFRPMAQVDAAAEQKYYDTEFTEQMKARGQQAPPFDQVRTKIHELLVQQEISSLADDWLAESRKRLKIEVLPDAQSGAGATGKQ